MSCVTSIIWVVMHTASSCSRFGWSTEAMMYASSRISLFTLVPVPAKGRCGEVRERLWIMVYELFLVCSVSLWPGKVHLRNMGGVYTMLQSNLELRLLSTSTLMRIPFCLKCVGCKFVCMFFPCGQRMHS